MHCCRESLLWTRIISSRNGGIPQNIKRSNQARKDSFFSSLFFFVQFRQETGQMLVQPARWGLLLRWTSVKSLGQFCLPGKERKRPRKQKWCLFLPSSLDRRSTFLLWLYHPLLPTYLGETESQTPKMLPFLGPKACLPPATPGVSFVENRAIERALSRLLAHVL